MKVAGGLNYVTGPMGAGKSLYGVRRIVAQLIAGGYAVTNVELLPGWSERVAWHVASFRTKGKRARIAEDRIRGRSSSSPQGARGGRAMQVSRGRVRPT